MLKDQHRALLYSLGLLFAMAAVFIAVGRHPTAEAPRTTVEWIGRLDASTLRVMNEIRNTPLSWLALALNVIGSGFVTTPLRALVGVWLGLRRRWSAVATWLVTWGVSELILASAKSYFHRGRPPHPQVAASGYAFPSGHAVAGAATAVAFVLILMPWDSGGGSGKPSRWVRLRDGALARMRASALALGRSGGCAARNRRRARFGRDRR